VANGAGKDTADDVVVMVTEVRRVAESEKAVPEVQPIGLPLTWSGSNPPLTVASVHPGSERHVDLLHLDCPTGDGVDITPELSEIAPCQLDLHPKPAGSQEILGAGTYEISAEVRARNADATRYVISVDWDGKWSGRAAVWDHLRVELPRKVRRAPQSSRRKTLRHLIRFATALIATAMIVVPNTNERSACLMTMCRRRFWLIWVSDTW
jgi:hypothetical protein